MPTQMAVLSKNNQMCGSNVISRFTAPRSPARHVPSCGIAVYQLPGILGNLPLCLCFAPRPYMFNRGFDSEDYHWVEYATVWIAFLGLESGLLVATA